MNKRPLTSFWIGLVITSIAFVPAAITAVKSLTDPSVAAAAGYVLFFLPLLLLALPGLLQLVIIPLILVGLWKRRRLAIKGYMVAMPLVLIGAVNNINQLLSPDGRIAGSLGYSAASSLALTGFIIVVIGLGAAVEFIAVRDLRQIS